MIDYSGFMAWHIMTGYIVPNTYSQNDEAISWSYLCLDLVELRRMFLKSGWLVHLTRFPGYLLVSTNFSENNYI